MRRPDRAEYFYPKPRYLREAIGVEGPYGLPDREIQIDAQELSIYVEVLLAPHVSFFTDLPFRFINPEINVNEAGLSDVSLGLKWAFILEPTRAVSFQVRGIAPTGLGERGMGSELYIVEPGLLWQEAIGDRVTLFGEVRDRIPIGQRSTFAGNILRYGLGASVMAFELAHVRVMPTYEAVGWTVLGGRESADLESTGPLVQDSRGTTIITGYYGVRFTFGDDIASQGYLAMSDLYLGYGQAYTNDSWYRDIIRIEYRLRF